MAVALLSGSFASDGVLVASSGANTFSFDSLTTGADRALLVWVIYEYGDGNQDATAVTYDGEALTHIRTQVATGSSAFDENMELWVLPNADLSTGSNDLVITAAQAGQDLGFIAAVYTGVDQTSIIGNTSSVALISGLSRMDLTSGTDDSMLLCGLVVARANAAPLVAYTDNTKLHEFVSASGNSGWTSGTFTVGIQDAGTFTLGANSEFLNTTLLCCEVLEASTGPAAITGTITVENADDVTSITGEVTSTGTITVENADDVTSITGTVLQPITGLVIVDNADDVTSVTGTVGPGPDPITGTITVENADDVTSIEGEVGPPPTITGTIVVNNADDVTAITGTVTVAGTITVENADDITSITGVVSPIADPIDGTITVDNADDVTSITGVVLTPITGTIVVNNADDFPPSGGEGQIDIVDGFAIPQYIDSGRPYDDGGLAVDSISAIDRIENGVAFSANGRLCVDLIGGISEVTSGLPRSVTGRVNVNQATVHYVASSFPFTTSNKLAIIVV